MTKVSTISIITLYAHHIMIQDEDTLCQLKNIYNEKDLQNGIVT